MSSSPPSSRMPYLDSLRVLASHVIVWHHLCFYGPMSDVAWPLAPAVFDFILDGPGRWMVQIFFVIGGLLTAKSLPRFAKEPTLRTIGKTIARRYRRVGFPYLVAVGIAIGANWLATQWMGPHESISAPPTIASLLGHVFLVHKIFGIESLTAGIWYLSIDFQMVLLVLLVFTISAQLAKRLPKLGATPERLTQGTLGALAVASLFVFNLNSDLDVWAIYYFGSYFLGMMLQWMLSGSLKKHWFFGYQALVLLAIAYEWRPRLMMATVITLSIVLVSALKLLNTWPKSRVLDYLGHMSYSLFLIHFPICLLTNAWYAKTGPHSPWVALGGMTAAYLMSLVGGALFLRFVEERIGEAPAKATPIPSQTSGAA